MQVELILRSQIKNLYSSRKLMLNRMLMAERKDPHCETLRREMLSR